MDQAKCKETRLGIDTTKAGKTKKELNWTWPRFVPRGPVSSLETQKKKNTLKATLDRLVKDCKIESIDVLIAQAKRDQDIAINEKVLLQQVSDGKDAKDKPYTFDNYWDEFLRMKKLTLDEDLPVLEVIDPKKVDK